MNDFVNSSKFVMPVGPYIIDSPKGDGPGERAPDTKYFGPASVENSLFLLNAAET